MRVVSPGRGGEERVGAHGGRGLSAGSQEAQECRDLFVEKRTRAII